MRDDTFPIPRPRRRHFFYLVRPELSVLILIVLLAGGAWLFVGIADEVVERETHGIDNAILLALRRPGDPANPLGPPWLKEAMRDITALGSFAVLGLLSLSAAGYLFIQRRAHLALLVLASTGGGILISTLLKSHFDRPRPDLIPHDMTMYTSSFPSQHSMMAAIVYLTLAALLSRIQPSRPLKIYVLGLAIVLALAIGVSRVYLGLHWPTDVLAGWAAGGLWAILCWLIARELQRRGRVEPAVGESDDAW